MDRFLTIILMARIDKASSTSSQLYICNHASNAIRILPYQYKLYNYHVRFSNQYLKS